MRPIDDPVWIKKRQLKEARTNILEKTKSVLAEYGFEYHGIVDSSKLQIGIDYDGEVDVENTDFHRWTGGNLEKEEAKEIADKIAVGESVERDFFKGIYSIWNDDWDFGIHLSSSIDYTGGIQNKTSLSIATLGIRKT